MHDVITDKAGTGFYVRLLCKRCFSVDPEFLRAPAAEQICR
jgi:hypothetical protein